MDCELYLRCWLGSCGVSNGDQRQVKLRTLDVYCVFDIFPGNSITEML